MKPLFVVSAVLGIFCFWQCDAISCDCTQEQYVPESKEPFHCPRGVVLAYCPCHHVCGRDLGELCGGSFGEFGKCGTDLVCLREVSKEEDLFKFYNGKGICVPQVAAESEETALLIRRLLKNQVQQA